MESHSLERLLKALHVDVAGLGRDEEDREPPPLSPEFKLLQSVDARLARLEERAIEAPTPEARRVEIGPPIAAGRPEELANLPKEYTAVPSDWFSEHDEVFAFPISGPSMMPTLQDGDLVAVRQQIDASHNDLVVALVGTECFVKRYCITKSGKVLKPDNDKYPTTKVDGSVRIQGKVVGILRKLKRGR